MDKLRPEEYSKALLFIENTDCGGVYARAVAERIQAGDIFTDGRAALFWHCGGFAFVYGDCDSAFLGGIYEKYLSGKTLLPKRFVLFADERVKAYFSGKPDLTVGSRLFFEYPADRAVPDFPLPEGFELRRITKELTDRINGRVVPLAYWDSAESFLAGGTGFCATKDGAPAAWAFSAAVSADEADIGVETSEGYRRLGLASAAAAETVRRIRSMHKKPVWACSAENPASRDLALKVGFEQVGECFTIGYL